jgi:hypothetical protein
MPNYCYNEITIITYDKEQPINNFFDKTARGADIKIKCRTDNAIELTFITIDKPNYKWLNSLINRYPAWWLKNTWWAENGDAGVWVGYHKKGEKTVKQTEWDDICINEINEMNLK